MTQNEASGEGVSFTTSLGPSRIDRLKEQEVTSVSSYGDHCLALSSKTGTVFAWGFGNNGRLGLGDGEDAINRVEQAPKYLKFFGAPAVSSDDVVEEEAQAAGPADDKDEDDERGETEEKARGGKEENDALTIFANLRQALSGATIPASGSVAATQSQDAVIANALLDLSHERNRPPMRERFQRIQHAVTLMKYAETEYEVVPPSSV